MYLYDKLDDKIDVYSLIPNKKKVYDYRKECMELIPVEERILKAVGKDYNALYYGKPIEFNGHTVENIVWMPNSKINKRWSFFTQGYHSVLPYEMVGYEYTRQEEIIDGYCLGDIVGNRIVAVSNKNKIYGLEYLKYLLISGSYYVRYDSENILHNIISIPKELFLLEWCLFGGSFDSLSDDDFRKIIELFDMSDSPIDSFNYDEVIKYRDYGLVDESSETLITRIDSQAEKSKETLRRIREIK